MTRRSGSPHHLRLRVGLLFVAAVLWIASVVSGIMPLTLAALAVLGVTVALRFIPERTD